MLLVFVLLKEKECLGSPYEWDATDSECVLTDGFVDPCGCEPTSEVPLDSMWMDWCQAFDEEDCGPLRWCDWC